MKKVIVTGGSGFIGSNLVNFLIKKKFFVINLDKLTYSSNKHKNNFRNRNNYKLIKVDIINKIKITEIIRKYKPKAIFNLAAETHVDRSIDNPYPFLKNNILGTFNLLNIANSYFHSLPGIKKRSFKFHHVSSDEVFGDLVGGKSPLIASLGK